MSKICWLLCLCLSLFGCVSGNQKVVKEEVALSHGDIAVFLFNSSRMGTVTEITSFNLGPEACSTYISDLSDVANMAGIPLYIGLQNPSFIIAVTSKPVGTYFFVDGYVFTGDRDKAVLKLFGDQEYTTCFENTENQKNIDKNKPLRAYRISGKVDKQ